MKPSIDDPEMEYYSLKSNNELFPDSLASTLYDIDCLFVSFNLFFLSNDTTFWKQDVKQINIPCSRLFFKTLHAQILCQMWKRPISSPDELIRLFVLEK